MFTFTAKKFLIIVTIPVPYIVIPIYNAVLQMRNTQCTELCST